MSKREKNTNDNVKKVGDILEDMKGCFETVKDGDALAAVTIVAYVKDNEIKFAAKDLSKAVGIHLLLCSDMFLKVQANMFQEFLLLAEKTITDEAPEYKKEATDAFQKMIDDIKEKNPLVKHLFDEPKDKAQ